MIVLMGGLMSSCIDGGWHDSWNANAYGTDTISEHNVITIAQLRNTYSSVITGNSYKEITDDIQLKCVVTGNDIGGNIYSQISVDDGTGAIIIAIAQGGLFGYLPVGQEILVNLKGLYIGGYGKLPQIGTLYTNASGKISVSRMPRMLWNQKFRLTNQMRPESIVPEVFDVTKVKDAAYMEENCGKLMTIKNVKFSIPSKYKVFAHEEDIANSNCTHRTFQGISSSSLVVRTSTYADFAAMALPEGTVNITGIFTRYNNTWQILIRSEKDIKVIE